MAHDLQPDACGSLHTRHARRRGHCAPGVHGGVSAGADPGGDVRQDQRSEDRYEAALPSGNFVRAGPHLSDVKAWRRQSGSGVAMTDDGGGMWWPVVTTELPCSTMELRGRRKASQNGRTPSCDTAHWREGRRRHLGQKPARGWQDPALWVAKQRRRVPRGVVGVLRSGGSSWMKGKQRRKCGGD
jgi:hypothetical protein